MIVHLRGDFSRLNNVNFFMFMHTEDLPRKRVHRPPPPKKKNQAKVRNEIIANLSLVLSAGRRRAEVGERLSLDRCPCPQHLCKKLLST